MNKRFLSIVSLLLIWLILSLVISNDIILPTPMAVVSYLGELIKEKSFYESVIMTFLRAHIGFCVSLIIGGSIALFCFKYRVIEEVLSFWIKGLQTIPQVSFIIFLYFWLDAKWCVYVVILLMAFPIAYFNFSEGLKSIGKDYLDLIQMSNHTWKYLVKKVYLPMCRPALAATIKSALPLSLKVCVMSEVLIYTTAGIGQQLSLAKSALDMTSVCAWTIVFVGLVALEMYIINIILDKEKRV